MGCVTIGIKPHLALPKLWLCRARPARGLRRVKENVSVWEVVRFREKPNPDLAEHFIAQGNFSWNAGMFIWTLPAIFSELSRHAPVLADFVAEVRKSKDFAATIKKQFGKLPKLSIDYALMEKASRVLNIEATFDWDDVGNWTSVGRYLPQDAHGNRHNCQLAQFEASDNIVVLADRSAHRAARGAEPHRRRCEGCPAGHQPGARGKHQKAGGRAAGGTEVDHQVPSFRHWALSTFPCPASSPSITAQSAWDWR